jgi:hypothetical protein
MRPSLNSLSSAHDPLGSCRRRADDSTPGLLTCAARSDATVALGSRPAPNTVQPARPHQAASRAAPVGGTARAAMLGIVTTAPPAQTHGRLRQGRWSPVSLRGGSRPSRGSAALALSTRGFSAGTVGETARLVADACAAGVAVVKKIALPSGGANAHDVFAAGGSSIGGARRGSSARVASCLPCSMATLRTAAGFMERCAARGAARGAGRAASADRYANACYRVARRETGHAGRSGAWGASRRDVRTRARGAGGVTCDTPASRSSPRRRSGGLRMCGCACVAAGK